MTFEKQRAKSKKSIKNEGGVIRSFFYLQKQSVVKVSSKVFYKEIFT